MKVISAEKARELRAGNAHFHWVCFDKLNFISKPYYCSLSATLPTSDRLQVKLRIGIEINIGIIKRKYLSLLVIENVGNKRM